MVKPVRCILSFVLGVFLISGITHAAGFGDLFPVIGKEISSDRAYGYVQRLWQYDKWSTLPMWQKTAAEARKIMQERAFDEADVVNTPADGKTQYSTWTNHVGWDVTKATLVVTEPHDVPGEYRYLSSYKYNPSSLTFFSCPTPPEGIEAELVVLDKPDPDALNSLNARGKIILVSSGAGQLKKYLSKNGVLGIICDQAVKDAPDANVWLNTWSDFPGGWMMTASDSRDSFCFFNFSLHTSKDIIRYAVRHHLGPAPVFRQFRTGNEVAAFLLLRVEAGQIGGRFPHDMLVRLGHFPRFDHPLEIDDG